MLRAWWRAEITSGIVDWCVWTSSLPIAMVWKMDQPFSSPPSGTSRWECECATSIMASSECGKSERSNIPAKTRRLCRFAAVVTVAVWLQSIP